ncbi:MAG: hypothetical protein ACSHXL_01610 [Bacteroidota bacterium]
MEILKKEYMWPANYDGLVYAREYKLFYSLGAKFARHIENGGSRILCIRTKKDRLVRHNNTAYKKIHNEFRLGFMRYIHHLPKNINKNFDDVDKIEKGLGLIQRRAYSNGDEFNSNLYLILANDAIELGNMYDLNHSVALLDCMLQQ